MTRRPLFSWLVGALLLLCAGALAGILAVRALELPPPGTRSLSSVLASVEDLGRIQSVEFERDWSHPRGRWEISLCRASCLELHIDAATGAETRRRSVEDPEEAAPPPHALGASAVAKWFEDGSLGPITEIEFRRGAWQVKYREAGGLAGALLPTKRRNVEPPRRPVMLPRDPTREVRV